MNIQYHLTEEEAREGLDGIYPKYNKNAMVLGFIFGLAAAGLILSMAMQGRVLVLYVVFAVLLAVLSVWLLHLILQLSSHSNISSEVSA